VKTRRYPKQPLTPRDVRHPYHPVWSALDGVVEAWESLEGGMNHSTADVAEWLSKKMAPAIQRARTALGRKRPT